MCARTSAEARALAIKLWRRPGTAVPAPPVDVESSSPRCRCVNTKSVNSRAEPHMEGPASSSMCPTSKQRRFENLCSRGLTTAGAPGTKSMKRTPCGEAPQEPCGRSPPCSRTPKPPRKIHLPSRCDYSSCFTNSLQMSATWGLGGRNRPQASQILPAAPRDVPTLRAVQFSHRRTLSRGNSETQRSTLGHRVRSKAHATAYQL